MNQRRRPLSRPGPYNSQTTVTSRTVIRPWGRAGYADLSLGWQFQQEGLSVPRRAQAPLTSASERSLATGPSSQPFPDAFLLPVSAPLLLAPDYSLFAWYASVSTDPQLLCQLPDHLSPTATLPAPRFELSGMKVRVKRPGGPWSQEPQGIGVCSLQSVDRRRSWLRIHETPDYVGRQYACLLELCEPHTLGGQRGC